MTGVELDRRVAEQLAQDVHALHPLNACDSILHELGALVSTIDQPPTDRTSTDGDIGLLLAVMRLAQEGIEFLATHPMNGSPTSGEDLSTAVRESAREGFFPYGGSPANGRALSAVDVSMLVRLVGGVAGSFAEDQPDFESAQGSLLGIVLSCAATISRVAAAPNGD